MAIRSAGDNSGEANIGFCYRYSIGMKKVFDWYLKHAEMAILMDKLIIDSSIEMV